MHGPNNFWFAGEPGVDRPRDRGLPGSEAVAYGPA